MRNSVSHWIVSGLGELREVGSLATAAYVTFGAIGSLAVAISWIVQRHGTRVIS
jgi:hypothetical protein